MKKTILILTSILITCTLFGQETYKLDYCNCVDNIEQTNPVLSGKYERQCNGKLIEKGEFLKGVKVGEWISYNKSGKLIARINYKNGLLNGKTELFYANGKPKLVAEFECPDGYNYMAVTQEELDEINKIKDENKRKEDVKKYNL